MSAQGTSKSSVKLRMLISLGALLMIPILLIAPQSQSQLPNKVKQEEEIQRERMVVISRQLGVTCNTCHDNKNFTSDKKASYKIAKEHIRLVQVLIDNGMDGQNNRPKADCYMCHRGRAIPDYKEPFNPLTMKKLKPGSNMKSSSDSDEEDEVPRSDIQLTQ